MGWGRLDFRKLTDKKRGETSFTPRPRVVKNMVSGLVAKALAAAISDHADKTGASVSFIVSDMSLGHCTWSRLKQGQCIGQETAGKIVRYLGTSVRAVLSKYQQEKV